jgi:hypothetical protein
MSNSFGIAGNFGEIQIRPNGHAVLVDVQTSSFDVEGGRRQSHACAGLSVRDAARLRELLGEAIAAADDDPRQTSLWPQRHPQ